MQSVNQNAIQMSTIEHHGTTQHTYYTIQYERHVHDSSSEGDSYNGGEGEGNNDKNAPTPVMFLRSP